MVFPVLVYLYCRLSGLKEREREREMGIKDLLRYLKPYTESIHIQKYAGKRVGIDAYSWLHKGAYSCSMELSLNSEGDKKFQYINYFMHRINLLRHHQITPVVVFDGGNIPCKAATENQRFRMRRANKEMAMDKLRQGDVNAAIQLFQRAISITPYMVHRLILILKSENVEFLVAPYEADAQLAYLSSIGEDNGGIVTVISEDSDLLAYGCPSIVFKMDRFGNGEEIILDKVFKSTNTKPSFRNFNTTLFIDMCVLAGCDFLPSIPGIGIAKAHALVSKYRNIDRVLSVLKFKGKQVPDDYARSFKEAIAVFRHASIYNRNKKRIEHLRELPKDLLDSLGELDFLGPDIPPTIAIAIAEGNLDPSTMEAYDCHTQTTEQSEGNLASSQKIRDSDMLGEADGLIQIFNKKNYKVPEIAMPAQALKVKRDEEKQAQSCFTVYSSASMRDEKTSNTSTVMVERQVLKERNFIDEAATLAKLATFSEVDKSAEKCTFSEEFPVKTPDNNPFRKRKFDSENASETTPSMSQDDELESMRRCQDSAKSKLQKMELVNHVVGKRRISSCKNSGRKNNTILNFFNRI